MDYKDKYLKYKKKYMELKNQIGGAEKIVCVKTNLNEPTIIETKNRKKYKIYEGTNFIEQKNTNIFTVIITAAYTLFTAVSKSQECIKIIHNKLRGALPHNYKFKYILADPEKGDINPEKFINKLENVESTEIVHKIDFDSNELKIFTDENTFRPIDEPFLILNFAGDAIKPFIDIPNQLYFDYSIVFRAQKFDKFLYKIKLFGEFKNNKLETIYDKFKEFMGDKFNSNNRFFKFIFDDIIKSELLKYTSVDNEEKVKKLIEKYKNNYADYNLLWLPRDDAIKQFIIQLQIPIELIDIKQQEYLAKYTNNDEAKN